LEIEKLDIIKKDLNQELNKLKNWKETAEGNIKNFERILQEKEKSEEQLTANKNKLIQKIKEITKDNDSEKKLNQQLENEIERLKKISGRKRS